jgi:hypothetical protein
MGIVFMARKNRGRQMGPENCDTNIRYTKEDRNIKTPEWNLCGYRLVVIKEVLFIPI